VDSIRLRETVIWETCSGTRKERKA